MSSPGDRAPQPSNEPLARQGLYATMLQAAEGDVGRAIDTVSSPEAALVLTFGYMDQLSAETGVHPDEVHRHAAAKIYGYLFEGSQGDTARLRDRQSLWDPVLSAVKAYKELGSQWEKVRAAVHFFDLVEAGYGEAPAFPGGGGGSDRPAVLGSDQEHLSGHDVRGAVRFFDGADEALLRGDF